MTTDDASPKPAKLIGPAWHPRRASGRLIAALVMGIVATLVVPTDTAWQLRGVVGWDVGAATLIALAWWTIFRASASQTHARASGDDPGRGMVVVIALGSSLFSLFAALLVIRTAKANDTHPVLWGGLGTLAVVLSWIVTHTTFALRYARLYYHHGRCGGLQFPGDHPPAEIDFAYFAFVIGMCFQTSDVTITSPRVRRAVLGHSVLSFVYNTVVVALVLNLIIGFLS